MNKQSGFTIVEVVVSIVIIGLLVPAVTGLMTTLNNTQKQVIYKESATRSAATEIETLRNAKYNTLENGTTLNFTNQLPNDLPKNKSGTVVISEPINGLKRVEVTVSYTDGNQQQKVTLTSLIGQLGLSK